MTLRLVVLIVAVSLIAAGCQAVTVHVPPEADLQGVRTVAVLAADLPGDPAPVAVLLRGEASSRIRRLLPTLTLVEPTGQADAILRMSVVRHHLTPVQLRVNVNPESGRVGCTAWQDAVLLVEASVVSGNTIRWQGILEGGRRLELICVPTRGATVSGRVVAETSPASVDPRLVRDVIDELGRRLAGYARKELRPIQTPPPGPAPAPDR